MITTDGEIDRIFDVDCLPISLLEMLVHLQRAGHLIGLKGDDQELREEDQKLTDTGLTRGGNKGKIRCAMIEGEEEDTANGGSQILKVAHAPSWTEQINIVRSFGKSLPIDAIKMNLGEGAPEEGGVL
ncbi:hypothetical protein CRG98_008749 [Punica granatum]|uniref:Uncharacterized protein n=1 Tax=Punica granatum TaxID=22663 RepID=A0A2I0KQS9_PUNGR|nr:hypothetical protein CRG98_008749 [Punica granatum]